jgi:predicted Rdx family selenoprotein
MANTVAAEYLRSLLKQREARERPEPLAELQRLFKRRDRRPPEPFHDSSFLYMRSYDADLGVRPFSGIVHWHSPDLTLSPVTGVGAYTTSLIAGDTYVVRCALRNRGDIGVPSAKVELFLTDPTLGFDTRFASNLTLGRVPSTWVPAVANAAVEFTYTVPPIESGHKCLFARAFSFSPLDLPIDDFALDPRLDRHVAQQNLNIVGQAQAYSFGMVHLPNARLRIQLRALEPEELLKLRHPVLAEVEIAREFPRRGWGRLSRLELREPGGGELAVREAPEGLVIDARDRDGLHPDAVRELKTAVRDVLRAVQAGETRMADHRDLLGRFRRMNAEARRSTFAMTIPDIGLQPHQAMGLEITGVDETLGEPEVFGGITLVIVGE